MALVRASDATGSGAIAANMLGSVVLGSVDVTVA